MDDVAGVTTAGVGAGGYDAGVPHAAHAAPDEGAPVLGNRCVPAAARGAGMSRRCMDREIRGSNPNSVRFFLGGFAVLCNVNAPMHDTGYLGIAMGSLRYGFCRPC